MAPGPGAHYLPGMIHLVDLDRTGLQDLLASWGQPRFRGKQLHDWLYNQGVTDFEAMGNLPRSLRDRLAAETTATRLTVSTAQHSKDGTEKRLYRLPDGQLIESVLMRYQSGRNTACISSQAGCAMGCAFCATGQMGFARHLSVGEIVEQAHIFSRELQAEGSRLSNVVLMGMGEPFHNYDAAITAVRRIMADLGIGARHITVSTVGLVPAIRRFAEEGLQVGLAISLHATDDTHRSSFMPVNRRWNVAALLEACRDYQRATHRRVTFEWALIAGENDSRQQAHSLGRLLKGLQCHVNLIPLNPTGGYAGGPSESDAVRGFVDALGEHGIPATVRVRRGIDIDAGCGQLKSAVLDKQA